MSFEHASLNATDTAEIQAVAEILSWAFAFPVADAESWMRKGGFENFRVVRRAKTPLACLVQIPMGQFFGGRSVPMVGIAGVATAAHARGSGVATEMMRATLRELHRNGVPLSTLYPATRPLYRRVGYEPAGGRYVLTLALKALSALDRTLSVTPITAENEGEVRRAYAEFARNEPGHLDRCEYLWQRIKNPRNEVAHGYCIERKDRVEGFVYLLQKKTEGIHFDLQVTDMVARTPAAGRRILALLADHGTTGSKVRWLTGPSGIFLQLLADIGFEIQSSDHWMLRIVDVPLALAARGYPDGVEGELHFDIHDDLIAENNGRFILRVASGTGSVQKGGQGHLRMDIRGLAPLYSGYLTAHSLAAAGLVDGTSAELSKAAAIFNGAAPWMPDMF